MMSNLSLVLLLLLPWIATGSTAVKQNLAHSESSQYSSQVIAPHPLGYDSAAEFLMRHLVLQINAKDMTTVELDRSPGEVASDPNVRFLFDAFQKISKEYTGPAPVSPFNVFVIYKNSEKTIIDKVFVDPTAPIIEPLRLNWRSQLEMVHDFSDHISRVLKTGQFKIRAAHFEDSQKKTQYVLRTNEAGRPVRVVGVDPKFEQFLLQQLKESVSILQYELKEAFYFGSRVMTRDKVVELNPEISENLPIQKGGLIKNAVREAGLTNISDLEVFLVVSPKQSLDHLSFDEIDQLQMKMRDFIRADLNNATRRFPFGLKVLIGTGEDSFQKIQNHLSSLKKWMVSNEQYARFYSYRSMGEVAPFCRAVLQAH